MTPIVLMVKVMVFGTYDLLHKGHEFFLKEAKKRGDELIVVIGRDSNVMKIKKRLPVDSEINRLKKIKKLDYVDKAVLGNLKDKYAVIKKIRPDIIVIGYDQDSFTDGLKDKLEGFGLKTDVLKLAKAYFPKKYKSSIIRGNLNLKIKRYKNRKDNKNM